MSHSQRSKPKGHKVLKSLNSALQNKKSNKLAHSEIPYVCHWTCARK